jgi:hypothetical protein
MPMVRAEMAGSSASSAHGRGGNVCGDEPRNAGTTLVTMLAAGSASTAAAPYANFESSTLNEAMDPAAIRRRREMKLLSMSEPVLVWATGSPGLLVQHVVIAIYSMPL